MPTQDYASIVRGIYDAYNNRDFDRAASYYAEDCQWTNVATGQTFHGPQGIREFLQGWATAFPDSRCHVSNVVSAGEWVIAEFRGQGTHGGPLMAPGGSVPPTGNRVDVPFCDLYRFRNGKIVEGRTYFDLATFMRQLGLMPAEGMPRSEHREDQPYA